VEEKLQDINKQMLETSYILNLGQLLKMALELKIFGVDNGFRVEDIFSRK
jgi:hypothetical protein